MKNLKSHTAIAARRIGLPEGLQEIGADGGGQLARHSYEAGRIQALLAVVSEDPAPTEVAGCVEALPSDRWPDASLLFDIVRNEAPDSPVRDHLTAALNSIGVSESCMTLSNEAFFTGNCTSCFCVPCCGPCMGF